MSEILIGVLRMPPELFWSDHEMTRLQHDNIRREAADEIERLQAECEKLRKDVGLLICDECHAKCSDPHTGLFASFDPDEEPCIMCECSSLRRQLAATRAGWQETIAYMASHERPAYDEQQQRIAKLESINLGLTKTMEELHADNAKLVDLLRDIGDVCRQLEMPSERAIAEWADHIDAALAAHCEQGGGQ